MNIYELEVDDLPVELRDKITVVTNIKELNLKIASEFAGLLSEKQAKNEAPALSFPQTVEK